MKKILVLALAGCLMANPILAATPMTYTQSINAEITNRTAFINFVSAPITIDYLHPKTTNVLEWIKQDISYSEHLTDKGQITTQILQLTQLVEAGLGDYMVVNGAKIYGFNTVSYLDALQSAIAMRYGILQDMTVYNPDVLRVGGRTFDIHDKTNNQSGYTDHVNALIWDTLNTDGKPIDYVPSQQELMDVAESVYDVIATYKLPTDILEGLEVYLSPYYLSGYQGFTAGYNFKGREELVLVAPSINGDTKQQALNCMVHEAGHLFFSDVIGMPEGYISDLRVYNSDLKKELDSYYPEYTELPKEEREHSISESFAEHFRVYVQRQNGLEDSVRPVDEHEEVYNLIERMTTQYPVDTTPALPQLQVVDTTIQGYEFYGSMPYIIRGEQLQVNVPEWDLNQRPLQYKILLRDDVTNSAITIMEGDLLQNNMALDVESGHYAVLIYDGADLLRFNEFDYIKQP